MVLLTVEEFKANAELYKTIARYDSTTEPSPAHPWFSIDQKHVDKVVHSIASSVIDILKNRPEHDSELNSIFKAARMVAYVPSSGSIRVAIIGTQGAGKSSLLNALFDCDGLSLTGRTGEACTSTIMNYAHRRIVEEDTEGAAQDNKLYADVKFLGWKKYRSVVAEHIRAYRYYHEEAGLDAEDDPIEENELAVQLNGTAEEFFTILFGSLDAFLQTYSRAQFLSEFESWCEEQYATIRKRLGVEDNTNTRHFVTDNREDMMQKIERFITKSSGKRSYWPLVDSIQVSSSHKMVQLGLEVVDLPGIGDSNFMRAQRAYEERARADVEIIVGDTLRIKSEQSVLQLTRTAIRNHTTSNVKIIATKIDSISDNDLGHFKGQKYDDIQTCLKKVINTIAEAEDEGDASLMLDNVRFKRYLEREMKKLSIGELAADVKTRLTALFTRNSVMAPDVYSVSAAEYLSWLSKPKLSYMLQPTLTPAETGIPALRNFLRSLPAPGALASYDKHIRGQLPSFVEKIKRVATPTDRDEGFNTIVEVLKPLFESIYDTLNDQVSRELEVSMGNIFEVALKSSKTYEEKIKDKIETDWFGYKSAALNQIVQSKGRIPKGFRIKELIQGCDWDKDLSTIMKPAMEQVRDSCEKPLEMLQEAIHDVLIALFKKVYEGVHMSTASLETIRVAWAKWLIIAQRIHLRVDDFFLRLKRAPAYLLNDVANAEDDEEVDTFVNDITRPHYLNVSRAVPPKGQGKSSNRYKTPRIKSQQARLNELFLDEGNHIFRQIMVSFCDAWFRKKDDFLGVFMKQVQDAFDECADDLNRHAPMTFTISPHGEKIREQLRDLLPELVAKLKELSDSLPGVSKDDDDAQMSYDPNVDQQVSGETTFKGAIEKVRKRRAAGASSEHLTMMKIPKITMPEVRSYIGL